MIKLKKKSIARKDVKKDISQLELTFQICDLGHKIRVTLQKEKKNHKAKFSINKILRDEIERKKSMKKVQKKQIEIKSIMIKFDIKMK